jgi:hypothetical protein
VREEAIDMADDVPQLLKMSQKELDDLFTTSPGLRALRYLTSFGA